ncbi:MAG TPA: hypothetical protein VKM55_10260 [Candidatus Lokiarchaeia archaeon]|nr:hypothetical protein [Candidatus Lokiarchaeia archaeon]
MICVIEQAKDAGAWMIVVAGGGEPFMYKQLPNKFHEIEKRT